MQIRIVLMFLIAASGTCVGQDLELPGAPSTSNRELNVIAPTLAAEQIDRAVLNRLLQEISETPELTQARLGVDSNQLQDIFVSLANAHSFINDNEFANVRAMCDAWEKSILQGSARIDEALAAYSRREQFTRNFIARYYAVVLAGIESNLAGVAKQQFAAYMNDRRRRMANAGAVTSGAIYQNSRSGADSIRFHCRDTQMRNSAKQADVFTM